MLVNNFPMCFFVNQAGKTAMLVPDMHRGRRHSFDALSPRQMGSPHYRCLAAVNGSADSLEMPAIVEM